MSSEQSKQIYEQLINKLKQDYKIDKIFDGRFGAYMTVSIGKLLKF
jgi:D-Tyr-tRNAtyr deacylase